MSRQYFSLGVTPAEESCAQLGRTHDFDRIATIEIMTYRAALIARYGAPPAGATLRIQARSHDFGTYYDLVVEFEQDDAVARNYAFHVENGLSRWSTVGFSGPFVYDDRGQLLGTAYASAAVAIQAAIDRLEQLGRNHCATPLEHAALLNLRAAFPPHAADPGPS